MTSVASAAQLGRVSATSLLVCLLIGVCTRPAQAAWSVSGPAAAAGAATTMPAGGNTPSGSASGAAVTVSWTAATLGNGTAVAGYVIKRYNAVNGAPATVGAGCSGVVTTTTCTEQSVPAGAWVYTDTPVQGSWTSGESPASGPITAT